MSMIGSRRKKAFRQAYEFVRRNATAQERRRKNLYNKRVHGPTYKESKHVLFHYPFVQPGKVQNFAVHGEALTQF